VIPMLAASCGSPRLSTPPVSNTSPARPRPAVSTAESDVLAAALARVQATPETLLDHSLVDDHHFVMIEPGTAKPALPAPFVAMTKAELDAEADRTSADVGFIHVFAVEVHGDDADIAIGGDVALPAAHRKHKLCCCEGKDHYTRTNGSWTYAATGMQICS
jgi:hypothetical protein